MLNQVKELFAEYCPEKGELHAGTSVERRLSEVQDIFNDQEAVREILAKKDPLLYRVSAVEPARGAGDLHYGMGVLYPGKVGNEYYMTKGHFHETREAAEVYIGMAGEGCMLLESEDGKEVRMLPLGRGKIVYVPGHTAHRTMNTGKEPLVYFGIYPANAGHDYGAIAKRNFRHLIVAGHDQKPMLIQRKP